MLGNRIWNMRLGIRYVDIVTTTCMLVWLVLGPTCCGAMLQIGEEVAPGAAIEETIELGPHDKLPGPLDMIVGNMGDFEDNGLLSIERTRLDTVGLGRTPAVVWTLKANRPVTCHHVLHFLNGLRDVRFYRVGAKPIREGVTKPTEFEVHHALIYFADRLLTGAANSVILSKDQVFDIWINMDTKTVHKLENGHVTKVVFGRYLEPPRSPSSQPRALSSQYRSQP